LGEVFTGFDRDSSPTNRTRDLKLSPPSTLHPTLSTMNSTKLATLTIKELKSIAQENGIEPIGDKRSKAIWISAIDTFQFELAIDLPLAEDVIAASAALPMAESICWEIGCANETPAPNQQRGASLVILVLSGLNRVAT
jgi:hypothetical protein